MTKYGYWTVIREVAHAPKWTRQVEARCDCGTIRVLRLAHLRSGASTSCGCAIAARHTTHGHSSKKNRTPEYTAWTSMNQRCENQKNPRWNDYGGRGIRVCAAWRESFAAFFLDMGPRPSPNHSIDRRENDGNYEPSNCRWATRSEQQRNRRNTPVRQMTEAPA